MPKGFVYVLSNPSMPGLVKIGFTVKVPTERALELSTTGVPMPYEVEFYCLVEDPAALEARVHEALSPKRQSSAREFFRVDSSEAVRTITGIAASPEHVWHRVPQLRARPSRVECPKCGAYYVSAEYCPKCQIKLPW